MLSDTQLTATTPALTPGTLVPIDVHFAAAAPQLKHPAAITFFSDFLDVPAAYLFHNLIETIFRQGITAGCGAGNYCPDASASRAQMSVFLLASKWGSAYSPPPPQNGYFFDDVPASHPFAPWIYELAAEGITSGCSVTPRLYCPESPVSRGQMAVFLITAKDGGSNLPPPPSGTVFLDVPVDHPFARSPNVTRLQVPGSPQVGWVRVIVRPGAANPWSFEKYIVPRLQYW